MMEQLGHLLCWLCQLSPYKGKGLQMFDFPQYSNQIKYILSSLLLDDVKSRISIDELINLAIIRKEFYSICHDFEDLKNFTNKLEQSVVKHNQSYFSETQTLSKELKVTLPLNNFSSSQVTYSRVVNSKYQLGKIVNKYLIIEVLQLASMHRTDLMHTIFFTNRDFRAFLIENLKFNNLTQVYPLMISPQETNMMMQMFSKIVPSVFKIYSSEELVHLFGKNGKFFCTHFDGNHTQINFQKGKHYYNLGRSKQICHHSVYLKNNKIAFSGHDHVIVYKVNDEGVPQIGEHDLIPIKSIANKIFLIENTDYALLGLSCSNIQLINFKKNIVEHVYRPLVEEIYDITPMETPWYFLVSGKVGMQAVQVDPIELAIRTTPLIHFKNQAIRCLGRLINSYYLIFSPIDVFIYDIKTRKTLLTIHDPDICSGDYISMKLFNIMGERIQGCIFTCKLGINFILIDTQHLTYEVARIHKFQSIIKRNNQSTLIHREGNYMCIYTTEGDSKKAGDSRVLQFKIPLR